MQFRPWASPSQELAWLGSSPGRILGEWPLSLVKGHWERVLKSPRGQGLDRDEGLLTGDYKHPRVICNGIMEATGGLGC